MDERLRPAEGFRSSSGWSHDWHPYEDYLNVHTRFMTELIDSGIVTRDGLSRDETRDNRELIAVHIHGVIECANGLRVVVDKWLDVRRGRYRRYEVKGRRYVYQALMHDSPETILRYDNAHGEDQLHRHVYGEEDPTLITLDELPTLTGVIQEACSLVDAMDVS